MLLPQSVQDRAIQAQVTIQGQRVQMAKTLYSPPGVCNGYQQS